MAIPVGGGVIYPNQAVVVTQPTAGVFKGFSAICPHQGCTVQQIAQGLIFCPCHLSTFSITDGSVKQGPAQTGLQPVAVKVVGTDVVVS
jgi:Rieske Fe-S protein